jgi:hypothetical protein
MACYSPLKGFVDKESGGITFKRSKTAGADMEVACGQCIGCRLTKAQTWGMRIVHEAQLHEDNCFITLTYDQEHLPADGSLQLKDFQNFMKRLRKKCEPIRPRYYHCGEYGEQLTRPHYHACLFGLDFNDKELLGENNGQQLYTSQMLANTWGLGFVTLGELTLQSAGYCARYITKKITGNQAQDHYLRTDEYGQAYWLKPEYSTMSRNPGIGAKWYEKYKTDLWPHDEVPVPGAGVFKKVPRYYEQILQREDPEQHEQIKQLRKVFRENHKEEYTAGRLEQKYKVKMAQAKQLKRGYENDHT